MRSSADSLFGTCYLGVGNVLVVLIHMMDCPLNAFGNYVHYEVGTSVEVRACNTDELFYEATIISYDPDTNTYQVEYEDGSEGDGIWYKSMMPSQRYVVYEDDLLKVVDGHVYIRDEVREARLLAFQNCPQLFQSATIKISDHEFEHDTVVFEFSQGLLFSIPIFKIQNCALDKVCVLGAGAGCISMALRLLSPDADIEVVELSSQVVEISQTYFGVPVDGPKFKTHIMDALQYVDSKQFTESFSLVVIDVTSDDAVPCTQIESNGLEIPPHAFVENSFFKKVKSMLKADGWASMNVIAENEVLLDLLQRLEAVFSSVYVLAVNPNVVVFMSMMASGIGFSELYSESQASGFKYHAPAVLKKIKRTPKYKNSPTPLGWFSSQQFQSNLKINKI